jgi:hypothetical protein
LLIDYSPTDPWTDNNGIYEKVRVKNYFRRTAYQAEKIEIPGGSALETATNAKTVAD